MSETPPSQVPPPGPPRRHPPRPPSLADLRFSDLLLALIIGLGLTRLVGVLVHLTLTGSGGSTPGAGPVLLPVVLAIVLQTAGLVAGVYWVAVARRGLAWRDLGLRAIPQGWTGRAVAAALIGYLLAALLNLTVQSLMDAPQENPQLDMVAPAGFSWTWLVAMVILVGALAPIAEELFFRGLVYGWLRARMGLVPAAVVSGVGFSLLHGIVWLVPALALLGVILALVYEKSGSLWAAVVTHGVFNTLTIVLFYAALRAGVEI